MKQFIYLLAISSVLFVSCNSGGTFKKAEKGMEYKIISGGSGNKLKNGNFFEIQFQTAYKDAGKDTPLADSRKTANQIQMMDSASMPGIYYKIFSELRKGDSVVIKQSVDSLSQGQGLPPFAKKGGNFMSYLKIVNVYTTREAADSANKIAMEQARTKDSLNSLVQLKKDDKILNDFLTSKNIKTQKTPKGVYVEILQEGTGAKVTDSVGVKMRYTGKSLEGKPFDSNIDSQFHHTDLLPVQMWAPRVITGWVDGLKMLSQGTKARFYIPSSLGYGQQGYPPAIEPNENLIFDVEVVEVLSKQQAAADETAMQQKAMQRQMQMQQMQQQSKGQQQPPANK
jgi:FKBP-type peptidyl-prolyl cis-trans isomerase